MQWATAVMLYLIIWWTVLFAVLPFGTRPVSEAREVPGGWRGVPAQPRIARKVIATTLIALLVWGACMAIITSDWLSFRSGWLAMSPE